MDAAIQPAVIEDARRRQRRRRVAGVALLALAVGISLAGYELSGDGGGSGRVSSPAAHSSPAGPMPVPARASAVTSHLVAMSGASADPRSHPFRGTPALLRRPRRADDAVPDVLRSGHHGLPSLISQSSHPGRLMFSQSRAVQTDTEVLYVIPTSHRGVCVLTASSFGCLASLGRNGIAWDAHNDGDASVMFVGIASSAVSGVDLVSDSGRLPARLSGNVFWIAWSVKLVPDPFLNLNPRFVIHYRDGRPPASDSLRFP